MNYIEECKAVFTQEFCNRVIEISDQSEDDIFFWKNKENPNELNQLVEELESTLYRYVDNYIQQFSNLQESSDFSIQGFSLVKQYPEHQDSLHTDTPIFSFKQEEHYRPFVCLVYLNEEGFNGGECIFPIQKKVIKPETGKVLFFPCSFAFPHFVNTTLNGYRYVIRIYFSEPTPVLELDQSKWD